VIKELCDRCGVDLTEKHSAAINGIRDADRDGNGTVTDALEILCPKCYRAIWKFARTKVKP
jgi:hypothetical protein